MVVQELNMKLKVMKEDGNSKWKITELPRARPDKYVE
jgi:hypothetical protein